MNKKQIYESIMTSVAKEVKRVINESIPYSNFLSKESQKDLRLKYEDAYRACMYEWYGKGREYKADDSINYHMKHIAYFIPVCDGKHIITIDKLSIKKDYAFGYSYMGQGQSFSDTYAEMDNVRSELENYFIQTNIEDIDDNIEYIKASIENKAASNYRYYNLYCINNHTHFPDDGLVQELCICSSRNDLYNGEKAIELNTEDKKNVLRAYEQYKEDFLKKLDTYLKKYGTQHIRMWSYCSDD